MDIGPRCLAVVGTQNFLWEGLQRLSGREEEQEAADWPLPTTSPPLPEGPCFSLLPVWMGLVRPGSSSVFSENGKACRKCEMFVSKCLTDCLINQSPPFPSPPQKSTFAFQKHFRYKQLFFLRLSYFPLRASFLLRYLNMLIFPPRDAKRMKYYIS